MHSTDVNLLVLILVLRHVEVVVVLNVSLVRVDVLDVVVHVDFIVVEAARVVQINVLITVEIVVQEIVWVVVLAFALISVLDVGLVV